MVVFAVIAIILIAASIPMLSKINAEVKQLNDDKKLVFELFSQVIKHNNEKGYKVKQTKRVKRYSEINPTRPRLQDEDETDPASPDAPHNTFQNTVTFTKPPLVLVFRTRMKRTQRLQTPHTTPFKTR